MASPFLAKWIGYESRFKKWCDLFCGRALALFPNAGGCGFGFRSRVGNIGRGDRSLRSARVLHNSSPGRRCGRIAEPFIQFGSCPRSESCFRDSHGRYQRRHRVWPHPYSQTVELNSGTLIASLMADKEEVMGTTGKAQANDTGDWTSNKEMNPAANSSVTEDGLFEDENTKSAGGDWRGEDESEPADPARGRPEAE